MSRIYFHTPTRTVEVHGAERAWLGNLCDDFGLAPTTPTMVRELNDWIPVHLYKPFGQYDLNSDLARDFDQRYRFWDAPRLSYGPLDMRPWTITRNTCARHGSPALRLAARIDAQCEVHGWAEGDTKAWMADTITDGLDAGIFRRASKDHPLGWDDVINLLREDPEPVVMSYSVTDSFPNPARDHWEDHHGSDEDWQAWDDLGAEEQWDDALSRVRADPRKEITPHGYDLGYNGLTWLDLKHGEQRTREVLQLADAPAESLS